MKKTKAFSLLRINYTYVIFICLLCLLSIFSTILLYKNIRNNARIHLAYEEAAQSSMLFQEGSDYLTNEVRLLVTSHEASHLVNYFDEVYITKRRDKALERLSKFQENSISAFLLQEALSTSNKLKEDELYAIKLMDEGCSFTDIPYRTQLNEIQLSSKDAALTSEEKIQKAGEIVFSDKYYTLKETISSLKYRASEIILEIIVSQKERNLEYIRFFTILTVVLVLLIFLTAIFFLIFTNLQVVNPIKSFVLKIHSEEKLQEKGCKEFKFLAETYNKIFDKHKSDEVLLRQKAEHDELTGILNRSAFAQITKALSDQKIDLVMFYIDIDYFKKFNDDYGHDTGDKVLKKVAQILSEHFRSVDFVSRIGGDEFAVIATDTNLKSKAIIAKKLDSIKEKLAVSSDDIPSITLSIGAAFSSSGYNHELYNKADRALYKVKQNGRNGYFIDESE